MKFQDAGLNGAKLIELEPHLDERGYFMRTMCRREFVANGVSCDFVQTSRSFSHRRGTLRGMHYQRAPCAEGKLIGCTRGGIWDVIVDLRPTSPDYLKWRAFELRADPPIQLFVPAGFAHGFLTLEDATEVDYQMTDYHVPEAAAGFRWDDPHFGITWPIPVAAISERDRTYPDFAPIDVRD
jgi:dTDP-4-dehydrorhamnose 3,5-epimerase